MLGTANSFSGGTLLNAGLLVLSNSTTAAGSGTLTGNGGDLLLVAPGGPAVYNNPLVLSAPTTIFTPGSGNNNQALGGALTGSETLRINTASGGTFSARSGMTMTGFSGTLELAGTGYFRWQGGVGSTATSFDLGDSTAVMLSRDGGSITLGALWGGPATTLRGAGSTAITTTYVIGQKGSSTFGGSILDGSISGSPVATVITKLGSATLTLAGTNNHTGNTQVGAGTLRIMGHNGPSPVVVSNSATLAGNGLLGGLVTVNSGGRVAPGSNGVGTLTFDNGLALNTATLLFDLSSSPSGSNDRIAMQGGTLTLNGAQTCQFTLTEGQLNAGVYPLISGGANTTASGLSFAHNLPAGARQTFTLQSSSTGSGQGFVQLVVSGNPTTLVWRGLADANWNTATTNWLNGATADRFFNFDNVLFDDTSAAASLINLPGTVNPASISVTAATARTFAGVGSLTGSGTLTKSGAGTLTLGTTNGTYTGNIFLAGGALSLTAGATLGAGNLTLSGGGTLNLPPSSPSYSYAGTISVPAGQSGTIYSPGLANVLNGSLVSGGTNSVLYLSSGVSFGGTTASQFDSFNGTIHILAGATLRFSSDSTGNTFGSLNPTFVINGSLRPRDAGNTVQLGALSGTGSIEGPQSNAGSGNTTYLIGGNHRDVVFAGVISSNSAVPGSLVLLDKVGAGRLTLTGNSTFTGGTTVEAGALFVNNATGSGTGAGALSVAGGATLGGSGFIGSPTTLDDFAILSPGNGVGTLTFNSDLSLSEFSALEFELGASSDRVVANAALSLAGILNVTAKAGFGPGSYPLFTYNPAKTFNDSGLDFGSLPPGYHYAINTTTLGKVKLVVSLPTPPSFSGISVTGGQVILSGTGGTAGADYLVWSTTNLVTPFASWVRLVTNQFDSFGNFAWSNSSAHGTPRQFYRLEVP